MSRSKVLRSKLVPPLLDTPNQTEDAEVPCYLEVRQAMTLTLRDRARYWGRRFAPLTPDSFLRRLIPRRRQASVRAFAYTLRAPFYRGASVECVCCGGRFGRFAGSACPRCGAAPRHRQLLIYLQTSTDLFDGPYRLLHIAPERFLSRRFSTLPLVTYVSGDLSDSAMFRFDVTKLPFADGSFDAIICLHVLEHVEDDLSAMQEFRRVLTPEGLAVLQVPIGGDTTIEDPVTDPRERLKRYGQEDHVRLYGRDFEKRLVNAGFRVTRVDPADELSETDRVRLGLHLGEPPLYVCEAAVLR